MCALLNIACPSTPLASHILICVTRAAQRAGIASLSVQSRRGIRGISKRSEVRADQPVPCMRPINFNLGVSMRCLTLDISIYKVIRPERYA